MESLIRDAIGASQVSEPSNNEVMSNDQIKIVTIGVGGGGNNTINRLIKFGVKGTELVAVNTDAQHLNIIHEKAKKILIGKSITKCIVP